MTTLDVAVLEQAKGYLDTQGWGKGDLVLCGTGEVCALGALDLALGCTIEVNERGGAKFYDLVMPYGLEPDEYGSPEWETWNDASVEFEVRLNDYERVLNEATRAVSDGHERVIVRDWEGTPIPIRSVVSWNDNPATTKQDVIDVFDRAIETIKSEEPLNA